MDIDKQIKLLEEQLEIIRDLKNLNHRHSRFTTWKKTTLSHLENIFSEGSEYVRRFDTLTFQEPRFAATGGSRSSYGDMGSFGHDLDRAKTILEDGIEALRRLKAPKPEKKPASEDASSEEPLPEEGSEDEAFFERAILEKTLSEAPPAETVPEENLAATEEVLEASEKESQLSIEEVIKGSREESEPSIEEVMKNSFEESGPTLQNKSVEDVIRYASSLLYHYISLEEDPKRKKALQGLRAELDDPKRSKEGIVQALKASWDEGKDVLIDVIARVFGKKR
jgi:hypothetical protein